MRKLKDLSKEQLYDLILLCIMNQSYLEKGNSTKERQEHKEGELK